MRVSCDTSFVFVFVCCCPKTASVLRCLEKTLNKSKPIWASVTVGSIGDKDSDNVSSFNKSLCSETWESILTAGSQQTFVLKITWIIFLLVKKKSYHLRFWNTASHLVGALATRRCAGGIWACSDPDMWGDMKICRKLSNNTSESTLISRHLKLQPHASHLRKGPFPITPHLFCIEQCVFDFLLQL